MSPHAHDGQVRPHLRMTCMGDRQCMVGGHESMRMCKSAYLSGLKFSEKGNHQGMKECESA